jgi:hypothetical protein
MMSDFCAACVGIMVCYWTVLLTLLYVTRNQPEVRSTEYKRKYYNGTEIQDYTEHGADSVPDSVPEESLEQRQHEHHDAQQEILQEYESDASSQDGVIKKGN